MFAPSSAAVEDVVAGPDAAGPDLPLANSPYEDVLRQGFGRLRFPAPLESQYLDDRAAERMRLLKTGSLLVVVLFNLMLVTDALMVPDQFGLALRVRLLFFTPLALAALGAFNRTGRVARERLIFAMVLLSACVTALLCVRSTDTLAAPYLICLSLILMFNGTVVRMRFWHAALIDAIILGMFMAAWASISNAPTAPMIPASLAMLATTVFTLYGSYWLEHEERAAWLMIQHERLLLDESAQANQHLDRLARADMLTGVANRRHFDEFLQQVWSRAQHSGQEVSLLMIDVDHFKAYNDHYGHPEGDACLKAVAAAVQAHLRRPGDLVARFGGEEFIAVLADTNLPLALTAAERVRAAVEQLAYPHAAAQHQRVTISIGVAALAAHEPQSNTTRLIAMADEGLYQAKAQGRNRVQTICPGSQA